MVQIARTTLDPNKTFYVALQKVFGIGRTNSLEIAEACGISKELKVRGVETFLPEREVVAGSKRPETQAHASQHAVDMV